MTSKRAVTTFVVAVLSVVTTYRVFWKDDVSVALLTALLIATAITNIDNVHEFFIKTPWGEGRLTGKDPESALAEVEDHVRDVIEPPPEAVEATAELRASASLSATSAGEATVTEVLTGGRPDDGAYRDGYRKAAIEAALTAAMEAGYLAAKQGWKSVPRPNITWKEEEPVVGFMVGNPLRDPARELADVEGEIERVTRQYAAMPADDDHNIALPWARHRHSLRLRLGELVGKREALRREIDPGPSRGERDGA